MIRCASAEMSSRSQDRPRSARPSISAISTFGSITTPLPITGVQPGVSTPEGSRCSAYFWPSGVITVCPALLPPWYRTTYPTCPPSRSVTLPLPSSPHWAPISTIAGMSITPGCQVTSTAVQEGGRVQQVVLLSLAGGCLGAPVLACRDALVAEGAEVSTVVPASDADIDAVL